MRSILAAFLVACGGTTPPAPAPPEPFVAPAPTPSSPSAAELYAECGEAVEGPSSPGECTSDADCATVGCSGEMCVTAAVAQSGVMTPCLERPCHAVLDRCGCVDGMCSWSLKSP
ncbi:MAG: eight-cysteine-cluster domain-containing protein [Myxococcales bacterium]|nr:eight-cysteine-cluster domain-containing protein [Myxococcales bacterium]